MQPISNHFPLFLLKMNKEEVVHLNRLEILIKTYDSRKQKNNMVTISSLIPIQLDSINLNLLSSHAQTTQVMSVSGWVG